MFPLLDLSKPRGFHTEKFMNDFDGINIAVIVPCYNEEVAIQGVVNGFSVALPNAKIYVYDNNSSDRTAKVAARAGAIVGFEPFPGKGNVMWRNVQ